MENNTLTIYDVHNYFLSEYVPLICAYSIAGVLGIVGNALTVAFYLNKRPSSTITFIVALALIDTCVCASSFGMVIHMCLNVLFSSHVFCKGLYVVITWLVYCSTATLWVISIDRYFKLSRPLNRQLSVKNVKVIVVVIVCVTGILSSHIGFTKKVMTIPVKVPHQQSADTVAGCSCRQTENHNLKSLGLVVNGLEVLCFVILCITVIVTYCNILRTLMHHRREFRDLNRREETGGTTRTYSEQSTEREKVPHKTNIERNTNTVTHSLSLAITNNNEVSQSDVTVIGNSTSATAYSWNTGRGCAEKGDDLLNNGIQQMTDHEKYDIEMHRCSIKDSANSNQNSNEKKEIIANKNSKHGHETDSPYTQNVTQGVIRNGTSSNISACTERRDSVHCQSKTIKRSERKATIMMMAVSVGFICCFLPYAVMRFTMRNWQTNTEQDLRSVYWIPFLLPILNSVVNPILYFGLNRSFRRFVKTFVSKIFSKLVCCKDMMKRNG